MRVPEEKFQIYVAEMPSEQYRLETNDKYEKIILADVHLLMKYFSRREKLMFEIRGKNKEELDEGIKDKLEKVRKLSTEDLAEVFGGLGDTREEYSMNPEVINRSIYGVLY